MAPLTINAGGAITDEFGGDAYFSGGNSTAGEAKVGGGTASLIDTASAGGASRGATIAKIDTTGTTNPAPQAVYQSMRYGNKAPFSYAISGLIPNASYKVRLHFAELSWTAAGQRQFHVDINGARKLTNFDILAKAGAAKKATVQEFTVNADANGQIAVQFSMGAIDNPQVNGIEVIAN